MITVMTVQISFTTKGSARLTPLKEMTPEEREFVERWMDTLIYANMHKIIDDSPDSKSPLL